MTCTKTQNIGKTRNIWDPEARRWALYKTMDMQVEVGFLEFLNPDQGDERYWEKGVKWVKMYSNEFLKDYSNVDCRVCWS